MKIPFRKLVSALAVLLIAQFAFSQVTPVQVTPQLLPPYSLQVSEYYSGVQPKMQVLLLNRDINLPTIQVKLRMTVESQNCRMRTKESAVTPTFTLTSGIPYYLTPQDLQAFFSAANIDFGGGMSEQEYIQTGRLPEGLYSFYFEAFELYSGNLVSNKGFSLGWLTLADPPILNTPAKAEEVAPSNPQNIIFNWTPRHNTSPTAAYYTDYVFTIVEYNDLNLGPEASFTTCPPLFRDSVQTTTYLLGPGQVQLISGKSYAWRVQAKAKNGAQEIAMFRNNGFSEVHWFTYRNNCAAPLGITSNVQGQRVTIEWLNNPQHLEWKVEYREANNPKAEWFTMKNTLPRIMITDLKPATQYEYRVGGACEVGKFTYSSLMNFNTTGSPVPPVANCGDSSYPALGTAGLQTLLAGDTIRAGSFTVKVEYSTGSGSFTGTGYVVVPWLMNAKVEVRFTNITISTDHKLVSGIIETTYDPAESGIDDIDEYVDIFTAGYGVGDVVTGEVTADTTVSIVVLWPNGIQVQRPADYDEITGKGSSPITITLQQQGGGTPVTYTVDRLPTTIKDKDGNLYQVNKQGTATQIGKTGGDALLKNLNTKLIDKDKAEVKFVDYPTKQVYAFDEWKEVYKKSSTFNKEYERIGDYYVSQKAIAPGQTDYLKAVVTITDPTINSDSIKFVSGKGTIYKSTSLGSNAYEISIVGGPEKDAQEIYAVYKQNGAKTLNLGKVKVSSYPRREYKVKIVPDSGMIVNPIVISDSVNALYNKLNIYLVFTVENNLPNRTWDLNRDGKLETESSNKFTSYSLEMKSLITLLRGNGTIDNNAYYLFFVNSSENTDVNGDMPLGKRYGFIFGNQNFSKQTRTIEHEIGHGFFALKHPFDGASYIVTDTLDNLMMYNESRRLVKCQWDMIHDPSLFAGKILKDDDDAKELTVNITSLNAFKKFLPFEHFTFITPSGRPISIPADKLTKVAFSTSDLLVNVSDNTLSSLVPIGSLISFTYDNTLYTYSGVRFLKTPAQVREKSEGITNQRFDYYKGNGKIYLDELVKRQGATYIKTTYFNLSDTSLYRYAIFGLPFVDIRNEDDIKIRIIKMRSIYNLSSNEELKNEYMGGGLLMGVTRLCPQREFSLYNTQSIEIPSGISIKSSKKFSERAQDFIASLNSYTSKFNSLAPLIIAHAQKITEFPDASLCIEQTEAEQFLEMIIGENFENIKDKTIEQIEMEYIEPNKIDLNYNLAQSSLFGYLEIDKNNNEVRKVIKNNDIDAIIELIAQDRITICNLRNLTGDELMNVFTLLVSKLITSSEAKHSLNKVFDAILKNGYVERVNAKLTENNNRISAQLYDYFRKEDMQEFAAFSQNMLTMYQFLYPNFNTAPFTFSFKMSDKENTVFSNYPTNLAVSNGYINNYNFISNYPSGNLSFNGTLVNYTLTLNGTTYNNFLSVCKQYWSPQRNEALQRYFHASPFDLVELDFNVPDAWFITNDLVNKKMVVPMFYAAFIIESKMDEISKRNTRQCMSLGLIAATVISGGSTTLLGGLTITVSAADFVVSQNYDRLSTAGYNTAVNDWEEIAGNFLTVSAIAELGVGVIVLGPKVIVGAKNIYSYVKINTSTLLTKMPTLSRSTRIQIMEAFEKLRMHSLRFSNISQRTLYESMFKLQLLFKVQSKNLIAATEQVTGKIVNIEVRNGTEIFLKEGNMTSYVKIGEFAVDANGTYIANIKTLTEETVIAEKVGVIRDFRYQANGTSVKAPKEISIYRIGNDISFLDEGRWMDNTFWTQRSVVDQNKNIIASASNNSKGAFGEMNCDVFLTAKEFQPLHTRKTALTDGWGETGIDGVFKKNDVWYIVESKFGSSELQITDDGKQLSDGWIRGSGRLEKVVGSTLADEIKIMGYKRILAKVSPDGAMIFKEVDSLGNEIGNFVF